MNPYTAPAPEASYGNPPPGGFGYGGGERPAGDRAGVSDVAVEMLRQTKPWVTLLAVMSFIGSALMLLAGLFMIVAGAFARSSGPFPPALLGAIYLPLAFLYIYPALKLWLFSSAIGRLVASRSAADLEAALLQQKSFWKFLGILTVVMIAVYGLVFVGALVVGIGAAALH